jgi:hypothetical protein
MVRVNSNEPSRRAMLAGTGRSKKIQMCSVAGTRALDCGEHLDETCWLPAVDFDKST